MRDLNHRMTLLVEAKLPKYGRFKELERLTKIKNATWQKWGRGKQRPTMEMIEAVSQLWPVNAFWLTTGEELPEVGLTSPRESASGEARNLGMATEQFLNYRQRLREEITASQAKSVLEGREPTPPRHNTCRLNRTKNLGAAKKDRSGTIRTDIQGPCSSTVAAA